MKRALWKRLHLIPFAFAMMGAGHHVAHHAKHVAARADNGGWIVWTILVLAGIVGLIAWLVSAARRSSERQSSARAAYDQEVAQRLALVEAGALAPITPDGIVPIANETFFYQQAAQGGASITERVYNGGNRALYVPLGHGFRYRVGGNAGAAQNVTNFMWGPFGTVYVSNRRIVFKPNGSTDIGIAPYREILAYDCFDDGLGIQVQGVGTMQFRTGDRVLGVLFKKVMMGEMVGGAAPLSTPSP